MSRTALVSYNDGDFVSLVLRESPRGEQFWIRAKRSTADFYGWTNHFQEQVPGRAKFPQPDGRYKVYPKSSNARIGGDGIRICRSDEKHGNPAGATNRIRVHSKICMRDLAELAHFTDGDWKWMEARNGQRLTRDEWEALYLLA